MPHRSTLSITLSTLLRGCRTHSALRWGQRAHAQTLVHGLQTDPTLNTDLLLMYSRCSNSHISRQLFDQIPQRPPPLFSWNILFSSYAQSQLHHEALNLFSLLLHYNLRPDHFTLPPLFKACSVDSNFAHGLALHALAVKLGLDAHVVVRTSILNMYIKSGYVLESLELFSGAEKDAIIWNSMIAGLSRAGMAYETLDIFRRLPPEVVKTDGMRFVFPSVLRACGRSGDLRSGMQVHGRVVRVLDHDIVIGNALVDMYAKCGRADDSFRVFDGMEERNVVTWSTIISCYGVNGRGEEALTLYGEMVRQGFTPNRVTFTSVLSSCSHSGMVDEGRAVFESMRRVYGLEPGVEHYACMVDLLGRTGSIGEALGVIDGMPMEPAASVWGALLSACAAHCRVEVAEVAAAKLFELEPGNASNYVTLCGIYEMVGMWDAVANVRVRMREMDMVKEPGCSWIDMKGRVHAFYKGNVYFHDCETVGEALDGLRKIMAGVSSSEGATVDMELAWIEGS